MNASHCTLTQAVAASLSQHTGWLSRGPRALIMGLADLDLSLPAIPGGVSAAPAFTADQIRAYAALYYYGELEATGLMSVAELLAEERDMLGIQDASLYRQLDALATNMHNEWYPAERRAMVFEAMLGLGRGDGIQPALGRYAATLSQFEKRSRYATSGTARDDAAMRIAGTQVLQVMASRAAMGLERATSLLHRQLTLALEVMRNAALHRRYGARDTWGFLSAVAAPAQGSLPDLSRIVRRAQSGATLLASLVSLLRTGSLSALVRDENALLIAAADWQMNAPPGMTPVLGADASQSAFARHPTGGWA